MPGPLRFDVFGKHLIEVVRDSNRWQSYFVGTDGKRREGPLIPRDLPEDKLLQYLADMYHESARPDRPDVILVAPRAE